MNYHTLLFNSESETNSAFFMKKNTGVRVRSQNTSDEKFSFFLKLLTSGIGYSDSWILTSDSFSLVFVGQATISHIYIAILNIKYPAVVG